MTETAKAHAILSWGASIRVQDFYVVSIQHLVRNMIWQRLDFDASRPWMTGTIKLILVIKDFTLIVRQTGAHFMLKYELDYMLIKLFCSLLLRRYPPSILWSISWEGALLVSNKNMQINFWYSPLYTLSPRLPDY